MSRDPRTHLINLPITRACIVKWNEGRAKHGEHFVGDPLAEGFEECLDLVLYVDQAEIMTGADQQTLEEIRVDALNSARKLQKLYRSERLKADKGAQS